MINMNEKFNKLFETVKFPNGATVKNRFVMAPMVVNGSSYEGNVGEDDILKDVLTLLRFLLQVLQVLLQMEMLLVMGWDYMMTIKSMIGKNW